MPGSIKKRKCVIRPKSEWQEQKMVSLRIVSKELWDRVQTRRLLGRKGSTNLRAAMKAKAGRRAVYLLSGNLKCGECGRSYTVCDSRRYKCSGNTDGKAICKNDLAMNRLKVEELVLRETRDKLLTPDALKLVKSRFEKLLKQEQQRRRAINPREDVEKELVAAKQRIDRIRRAIQLTDDDIDELAEDLNIARTEQKELEAKLNTTPKTLSALPDAVYKGLDYYRAAVGKLAQGTGSYSRDIEKRALIQNLVGEIQVRPVRSKKSLKELELEWGIHPQALPAVLPAGRTKDAYNVVAGA